MNLKESIIKRELYVMVESKGVVFSMDGRQGTIVLFSTFTYYLYHSTTATYLV